MALGCRTTRGSEMPLRGAKAIEMEAIASIDGITTSEAGAADRGENLRFDV